jgi:hypothetical protein
VVSGAIFAAQGCYGRICEGSTGVFGTKPGEGRMLDENTWESTPLDAPWLPFPGARTWIIDMPQLGGRRPQIVIPYVSASPEPVRNGQSFTPGGGNIAELYNPHPDHIEVKNGTCAEYYLRVVVIAAPLPPKQPPPGDAGTD